MMDVWQEENFKKQREELRRDVLRDRDSLSLDERHVKSAALHRRLWDFAPFADANMPFIYVNFRSEVETLALINQGLERGKPVIVPLVAEGNRLIPYRIADPERDLRPGAFAIPEPDPQRCTMVDPASIDIVLLPGSVFDEQGGRLGYGGGYYDRFLVNEAPQALRVGICFDLQMVRAVPLLPHDQRLHALVTETRVLKCPEGH